MENKSIKLNWYNFFINIKLPISIVITIVLFAITYNYNQYQTHKFELTIWFCTVATAVLYTILLYKMYYRAKDTYFYFVICLITDIFIIIELMGLLLASSDKNLFIIALSFILLILCWFLPNYSYIKNRKGIFTGDYNPKDISNANDLPMRWYKFYNYVRLPLGIAFGIYDLLLVLSWFSLSPTIGIIGIIICLFQIIYLSYLLNIMNKKLKNGFTYIVIWLIIETFFMGLNITLNAPVIDMPTFFFSIIVGILVWFWPNYVYFNKRKYVFTEDK